MPWKETRVEDERVRFIAEWNSGDWTMAELCREFGISRRTGYKWKARYADEGPSGLATRSSAPVRHPNAVPDEIRARVLEAKREHPRWGPRVLRARLMQEDPEVAWPSHGWIHEFLQAHGLTVSRQRRARAAPSEELTPWDSVNDVWCADLKGWFRCGDGARCEPLTLLDGASRYLLRCQALERTDLSVLQPLFEAAFREFGLPLVIRTDNGAPFATVSLGGLSEWSVWWIKLGIRPERIERGKPQQNGRLERLHKTLKAETTDPPARTLRGQQRLFNNWRREYNEIRPHQALDYHTPTSCYQRSPRLYRFRRKPFEYPEGVWRRRVNKGGCIRWDRGLLHVGEPLVGELVGLQALGDKEDRYYRLFFERYPVAVLDCHYMVWVPDKEARRLVSRYAEDQPWHW